MTGGSGRMLQVQLINTIVATDESDFWRNFFIGSFLAPATNSPRKHFVLSGVGMLRDAVQEGFLDATTERTTTHEERIQK